LSVVIKSWALASLGQARQGLELMQPSLDMWQSTGIQVFMPLNFGILTGMYLKLEQPEEALDAVQRALGWVATTGERFYEAELHRLQGESLRAMGHEGEAKRCFFRARSCARRQEAGIFELRAILSLSRQPCDAKRRTAVRRMLERTCERFAQLDSMDLSEARERLAQLSEALPGQLPQAHA
jgi:predicted ATPase